jgi:hypothetical protein
VIQNNEETARTWTLLLEIGSLHHQRLLPLMLQLPLLSLVVVQMPWTKQAFL